MRWIALSVVSLALCMPHSARSQETVSYQRSLDCAAETMLLRTILISWRNEGASVDFALIDELTEIGKEVIQTSFSLSPQGIDEETFNSSLQSQFLVKSEAYASMRNRKGERFAFETTNGRFDKCMSELGINFER